MRVVLHTPDGLRLETEALRSTCSPVSLSPAEGQSNDTEQLAEAAGG